MDGAAHGVDSGAPGYAENRGNLRGTRVAEQPVMNTTTFAYRDDSFGMALRLEELRERRAVENDALRGANQVRRRRVARTVAGALGVAAAAVIAGTALGRWLDHHSSHTSDLTGILLGAWPVMGLAYLTLRADVRGLFQAAAKRLAAPADLRTEIARLERPLPVDEARARARRLQVASISLPLVALALLAPLTLHALVAACLKASMLDGFDDWVTISLAIVGHAHVALAFLSHRYARRLAQHPTELGRPAWGEPAVRAWGFTILASAIPGAVFLLLPPILTAVTGLAFVPLAFWAAARLTMAERATLDEAVGEA